MKPHYPILDGLRGTAAVMVVTFHLFESFYPDYHIHPIHHGYLAVDFFFMLSGFVIGYAYDDRWGAMSTWTFFKTRLIRLHPLVILSAVVGAVAFWFDPYKGAGPHVSLMQLVSVMLITFTLLPSPDVHTWGETHSLNGPLWSLLQEYIANIIYALIGRRMNKVALSIVVLISAAVLAWVCINRGDIATGWGYDNFWIAIVRMVFPFFAGYLLFRSGRRINVPFGYVVSSVVLIILFMLPYFKYNGLYEAAVIIIAFPIIIAIGAGSAIDGRWAKVCKFSGAISYPIYILHYPFIYIFIDWINKEKQPPSTIFAVGCVLLFFFIAMAYTALRLYDEPVRTWLKRKWLGKAV